MLHAPIIQERAYDLTYRVSEAIALGNQSIGIFLDQKIGVNSYATALMVS